MTKSSPLPQFGTFVPVSEIASGGAGRVVLAKSPTGASVALKIARDRPHATAQVRREFKVLEQLSYASPYIAQLVSPLCDGPPPWFALEFVQGHQLSVLVDDPAAKNSNSGSEVRWARSRPAGRDAWLLARGAAPDEQRLGMLLALMSKLAAGLFAIHRSGYRHGDLTPANILVRHDGSPVIIDFGSAATEHEGWISRERPQDGLPMFATRGYVAPEIHEGRLADMRSDLYSLGCIYCTMLFGEPPPLGEFPRLPNWLPEWLGDLITRMLAATPSDRISSASEVQFALEHQQSSGLASGLTLSPPSLRARTVGRDPTLKYLRSLLAELASGAGQLITIVGESGIGKTRILNELVLSAARIGASVITASCPDPASHATLRGPAVAVAIDDWLTAVGKPRPPALERLINPAADAGALQLREIERAALLDELFGLIAEVSAEGTTVLAVDDAHWADDLTLAFLGSERMNALLERPVMVMVLGRPETSPSGFGALVGRSGTTLPLRRLNEREVRSLAQDLLGSQPVPPQIATWLHRRTEGNPMFVTEFIRNMVAEGLLRRSPASGAWELAPIVMESRPGDYTPSSLGQLLDQRLLKVRLETRKLARLAASLDVQFTGEEVEVLARGVWGPEMRDTTACFDELVSANVIQRTGPGRFRFTHAFYRERCLSLDAGMQSSEFSRRLAVECEKLPANSRENRYATTGALWAEAGEPVKAFQELLLASQAELQRHKARAAQRLLEQAMVQFHAMDGEQRSLYTARAAHAAAQLAELLHKAARYTDAVAGYTHALSLWPESDPIGRVANLRRQIIALTSARRYSRARELCEVAETTLERAARQPLASWWSEWIELSLARFWLDYYAGSPLSDFDALRVEVERFGTPGQHCSFLQCVAAHRTSSNGFRGSPESVRDTEQALALVEGNPDLSERMGRALLSLAFPLLWADERPGWERAKDLLQRAERHAAWLDDIPLLSQVRMYLTVAYRRLGQVDDVQRSVDLAAATADRTSSPSYKGAVLSCRAWLLWKRNRLDEAHQLARLARQQWSNGALRFPFQFLLNLVWMDVLRVHEEFETARALAAELLAPDLHRLPEPLSAAINSAQSGRQPAELDRALLEVMMVAQRYGYL